MTAKMTGRPVPSILDSATYAKYPTTTAEVSGYCTHCQEEKNCCCVNFGNVQMHVQAYSVALGDWSSLVQTLTRLTWAGPCCRRWEGRVYDFDWYEVIKAGGRGAPFWTIR